MNHSIYSADRTTHLKVVIVALIAEILVAGFGISMHTRMKDCNRARDESRQTGDGHNVEQKRKIVKAEFRSVLSKFRWVHQRMRLECGVGFRQRRTCRRIRPGQLCARQQGDIRTSIR